MPLGLREQAGRVLIVLSPQPSTAKTLHCPGTPFRSCPPRAPLLRVRVATVEKGLSASSVTSAVGAFLDGRSGAGHGSPAATSQSIAEFVCESDVQQAIDLGKTILVGERTIVTPLARDLGEAHKVLVSSAWAATARR